MVIPTLLDITIGMKVVNVSCGAYHSLVIVEEFIDACIVEGIISI
jgi:hypothetical protein